MKIDPIEVYLSTVASIPVKILLFIAAAALGFRIGMPLANLFALSPVEIFNPLRLYFSLLPESLAGALTFFFLIGFAGFLLWMFCRLFTSTETLRTLFITFSACYLVVVLPTTWIPFSLACWFVFYLGYRKIPVLRRIREGEMDIL